MSRIKLTEKDLINLVRRVTNEQAVATWDCEDGECVKVVGKGGVGEFASEQECEDSMCTERARPGGYGGRGDSMSALDTQALNEQNNTQLYQAAAAGDAQALCKLCKLTYWTSSQRNKYCRCSTCTCSTGQIDNNLLCKLCNMQYWNTSDRNKHCRCSTCVCSQRHGVPTTTNLGVDKDFRGPSEFDDGNVQTEAQLNKLIKRTLNETQLLLEIQKCYGKNGGDGRHHQCDGGRGTCVKNLDGGGEAGCCYGSTLWCRWQGDGPTKTTGTSGDDRMAYDSVTVSESQLKRIIKKTINESQLLTEDVPCPIKDNCCHVGSDHNVYWGCPEGETCDGINHGNGGGECSGSVVDDRGRDEWRDGDKFSTTSKAPCCPPTKIGGDCCDRRSNYGKVVRGSASSRREMGEGLGPSACPPVSCAKTQSPGCCEGKSQHPVTCRCVRTSSLKRKRPNNKGINKGNR